MMRRLLDSVRHGWGRRILVAATLATVLAVATPLGVHTLSAAPSAKWTGGVTNGPRDRNAVALTFDDGLNGKATLEIARVLDEYRVSGTFFVIGRTLTSQIDVANTLVDHGHLLANHSYGHETALLTDTKYRDLARAQRAFSRITQQCPRFFRPPHGVHTPGMSMAVRRAGMELVNWDVEVKDWRETDADRLAANVLQRARGGSIVLLHDGRDGQEGADRDVLIRALPKIIEGLRARGLAVVRLDELLGKSGYLDRCP